MKRNFGLDLCRTCAILMVLLSHFRAFFSPYYKLDFLGINGYLGVELFFVLSGFLIGNIIINDLIENNSSLKRFYYRRWFRTLPLYYVMVLLLSRIREFNFQSLFFIQNFNERWLEFFPVSWSLCVEEWFYLIIPLFFKKIVKNKKSFFVFCGSIILVSLILRIIYFFKYSLSWDFGTRKVIFFRMDALVIGVLFAGIKYYYKNIYIYIYSKNSSISSCSCFVSLLIIL